MPSTTSWAAAAPAKAKIEAEKNKKQKEWEKLLKAVDEKKEELKECEANINELDDDLRETLVHRSKVLGKDRFLNKYYWFEHNGMPFGGVVEQLVERQRERLHHAVGHRHSGAGAASGGAAMPTFQFQATSPAARRRQTTASCSA